MKRLFTFLIFTIAITISFTAVSQSSKAHLSHEQIREKAHQHYKAGNYKDALAIYQDLVLKRDAASHLVSTDLNMAISCLQSLNRTSETDDLRERVIKIHRDNWRLLYTAAQSYYNNTHYGYIVAGEFYRGHHRGGGRYVNSLERDRIRTLQLMTQAMKKSKGESSKRELANFHVSFAGMLIGYRGYSDAWRLQYLSDISSLPDYEDGYRYAYGSATQGAPVMQNGTPVYHGKPKNYAAAQSDGERWRWTLDNAIELDSTLSNQVRMTYANFLHQQFDVQTMSDYSAYFQKTRNEEKNSASRTYDLHTLGENETIARMANGTRRFTLPEEFNFIKIYQRIADNPKGGYGEQAMNKLAQIFENRRQYDKAALYWKLSRDKYGNRSQKQKNLDQILKNWGQFEPVMTHAAGKEARVEYCFRNGRKVTFEAHKIHVTRLLDDVKAYLKSNPRKLSWDKIQLNNIGYRLVEKNEKKYVGERVSKWTVDLKPRDRHFDKRITVKTPLKKAGAYLLTARMEDGNTCKIVIWINDTVIVKKRLDNKAWYFVADAVTGRPLSKVNVECFGYRQESTDWEKYVGRHYNILTQNFAEFTDNNGQVFPDQKDSDKRYQWLIMATTKQGRLAYLGFSGLWHNRYYDREYNQNKAFVITDRPVYRPNQSVKFKFWVRNAKYDQEDTSSFANRNFTVRINNPKGEKVLEKSFTADAYGGFDGEYVLPQDATLGMYSIQIPGYGGGSFRVEEYKKPEFEVKIKAPDKPVMLGERINAKIKATYYFGAPVVKAKVKYKVLRYNYRSNWYPVGIWDWFYGPGYWWFAYDYEWYPGWHHWGCKRPRGWWWPIHHTPPEVVAEAEAEIGKDGTINIEIDTSFAKEVHGNTDHKYEITAEVTDKSRRTIVGKGTVLVARKPFKVYAWVDRGHYRAGDIIHADFSAQTLDNKPVKGKGVLNLYRTNYKDGKPNETSVQKWDLDTNDLGRCRLQIKASKAGQYRLSYKVVDSKKHAIEGGYIFCVRGEGVDGKKFRFNEIELVTDKREYAPGDKIRLMINTDQPKSTVVLFSRPSNGIYLRPEIIQLNGKSVIKEISVAKKDMPNFFMEAFTITNGRMFSETREIIVPPEKRVLNVEVLPSSEAFKPGEKANVTVKLTDFFGKPFVGSTVMSVYDKSVEYISGGSNVPEIKDFFWKWRRNHRPWTLSNLDRYFQNLGLPNAVAMRSIGVFGHTVADEMDDKIGINTRDKSRFKRELTKSKKDGAMMEAGIASSMEKKAAAPSLGDMEMDDFSGAPPGKTGPETVQPVIRTKFADTAFWIASLTTNSKGIAEVNFDMPENLTGWKIRTWAMGHGTVVGEGTTEVVTTKNLLLRLQAPRFFVEKDEVVLSANIHNYLDSPKKVRAALELDGNSLELIGKGSQGIKISAGGEERVDWRVKVKREGEAIVRMKALTDEESDAMEMRFPVYVHGMLKTESFCGVIRPNQNKSSFVINVPLDRRIDQSRVEIRYSPTLAGAMVDALPYLVEYPYGCTEQTLNRFLPTVITQNIIKNMGLDLKAIQDKQTNLNAQEIGNDRERAKQWKHWKRNPVFDEDAVNDMVKKGLKRLTAMQLSDGGWGWFSGWRERSYPHTTAYVVHGLQTAKQNNVAVVPGVLEQGIRWLENYQAGEVKRLKNAEKKKMPWKQYADNLDAFVYMVLSDAGKQNSEMRDFLYRDRKNMAVYGKAMYGMALYKQGHKEKLDMILRNISQYLVHDKENQTAWLNLHNNSYWWYWYGSEYEALAYYLKLLSLTDPKSETAAGLVKYLLNNRKHSTYWNSTRDTALCIEALADYLKASGEDKPDMTVAIHMDSQKKKETRITSENLFFFDNKLVLTGKAVESGKHRIEITRTGKGPIYYNAYLTNFTLEDFITRAGLEIKVLRKYYRLKKVEKTLKVAGSHGQALDQKVEKFERVELENLSALTSGDLVEIELEIESKNDYEYIVFEDMKAAGFEPVEVRSGYNDNDMGAYMELRDERVCFFVRWLPRGKHSLSYRMRAEIPGKFSALPTRAFAMYSPELKANSDEIKLRIHDAE